MYSWQFPIRRSLFRSYGIYIYTFTHIGRTAVRIHQDRCRPSTTARVTVNDLTAESTNKHLLASQLVIDPCPESPAQHSASVGVGGANEKYLIHLTPNNLKYHNIPHIAHHILQYIQMHSYVPKTRVFDTQAATARTGPIRQEKKHFQVPSPMCPVTEQKTVGVDQLTPPAPGLCMYICTTVLVLSLPITTQY